MSLNLAAYEALGSPAKVELLYDRESNRVGLRAVDPDLPHAYGLRRKAQSNTWLVTARSFVHHYGIDLSAPRRFGAAMEGDVLVIDLSTGAKGG